jgi:hypothetical protein
MTSSARADTVRLAQVLSGTAFPAAKWQLVIQVEDYGADARSRADMWRLPAGTYADLGAVLVALGLPAPGGAPAHRDGYREAPPAQAAALDGSRPTP